ncbi:fumarylacetoacetate hydrolase family protein [Microbacterium pseudoresistens]|uniref:2-keto-4-pentenoate hydratase/2-oxohepta-3-ene-1,7-dioic acid hydratase in catechol pathway n=1 Tax=Microbacterium pseudoresistens TaxID=640634 RepID=A0A7Y9EU61_9MICO|nr:fumarylacetoacetate hydrolase family protein [Microbacterium pseudoresistens]NYD53869.1 2-keto-4-pentenoate hydratase/2-oxohepta-3-ene-1,7-dioic acid hydratase in catechol pathway [Microbacterium pseudoresistens]
MRIANVDGRATLVLEAGAGADVFTASAGQFGPDPHGIFEQWAEFRTWANNVNAKVDVRFDAEQLGAPVPSPRQIFAIGLNYDAHANESGFATPEQLPPVFTKFQSSLSGPQTTVMLPEGGNTDWEVELVAVIGQTAQDVPVDRAWEYIAGLTVGQDISERIVQLRPPAPQFGLGKSFAGFAPTGPWVVTPDEFANPDDLELGCEIDGEVVQQGRTSALIFSVPELLSELSRIVTLYPGDLIFTGTPAGVGMGREPQRFLQDGEHLRSWVEGIGELRQTFVSPSALRMQH